MKQDDALSFDARNALTVMQRQLDFYRCQLLASTSAEDQQRWAAAAADLESAIETFRANAKAAEDERLCVNIRGHLAHIERELQAATRPDVIEALNKARSKAKDALVYFTPRSDAAATGDTEGDAGGIAARLRDISRMTSALMQAQHRIAKPVCPECGRGG